MPLGSAVATVDKASRDTGARAAGSQVAWRRRRELIRRRDSSFRRSLAISDSAAVTIAAAAAVALVGDDSLRLAFLAVPPVLVMLAKALGLYDRDEHLLHKTTLDEVPALFALSTLTALLLWLSSDLFVAGEIGRLDVIAIWGLLFVLMVGGRALARLIATRLIPPERCLLVGDPARGPELREKLALTHSVRAQLVGVVPVGGGVLNGGGQEHQNGGTLLPELGPVLASQEIDRVVLAPGADGADHLLYIIRELKEKGVKVSVLPEASRVAGSSVEIDHVHGLTLLGVRRFEITRSSRLIKRGFDLLGSSLALALLAPLFAAIAVAIKLDSRGPVFFRQRRVGRDGGQLEVLKFRSMVEGAELQKEGVRHLNEGAEGLFKIAEDPRVTAVGRFLRRWQLDELPQLLNVLRGEMSLVGPRPLIPEEDRQIEGWYRRRLDVAPGITGHWQVLGSSTRVSLDEMVKLDYLYVANWSLWNDLRLLMRTVPFVLSRRGV